MRAYFLDMERLAVRLPEYTGIRVDAIVGTDNKVPHLLIKLAADQAKASNLLGPSMQTVALDRERPLKAVVCEVLIGHPPAYWWNTFGRGVRDVLDTGDAFLYSQCYETARALIDGDIAQRVTTETVLRASCGGKVLPAEYAHKAKQRA